MVAQSTIQYSFNKGEWSPRLAARVDLAGYNSGAELLENFFVDYRGGATIRPGSKYCLQAYDSANPVRLIPFQASTAVGYILEFGEYYLRFYYNGAPVLESSINITGVTKANPCVVTVANSYSVGDVVYIDGIVGMTQLNKRFFKLSAVSGTTITLADLNGVAINSSAYTTWSSGGTVARVYKIASPYAAADLEGVKFCQSVSQLILCHPDYEPQLLTLNSAANWTIAPISFGTALSTPTGVSVASTLGAGSANYAYQVTAVDINGQESAAGVGTLASKTDIRTNAGTNTVTWTGVSGAVSYNIYRGPITYNTAVPSGVVYGYMGTSTGLTFIDSNGEVDFSISPPMAQNPFVGGSVIATTITAAGSYGSTVPTITFGASPTGTTATGTPIFQASAPIRTNDGSGYSNGETVTLGSTGIQMQVTTGFTGDITGWSVVGSLPSAIGTFVGGAGIVVTGSVSGANNARATVNWTVTGIYLYQGGTEYVSAPTITFSSGAATATATLGAASSGNPVVPAIFQQRLWLLGQTSAPQSFHASQVGTLFNFNKSLPIQLDDAIVGEIAGGQLNTIKAAVPMQAGLVVLSDRASWLINGGSAGSAVTTADLVANPQAYNGISDVPPIVSNYDILYVQAKGSIVRNMAYSFYTNVYTGTDISVVSSHLFYGRSIVEWAWAEEPFKLVWAVRDDGVMLTLTFEKQQEFIAWAHSTTNGDYKSVCSVTEEHSDFGLTDAVYTVVERVVNGYTVKYIERFEDQHYPTGVEDAWQVDAGVQYDGSATTSFTGAEHLAGMTVTGLADGEVITPFVMPTNGFFTLTTAASLVTIGLGFTAKLKSLRLDLGGGQATVQGKAKKVPGIVVRVAETLGLKAGTNFNELVNVRDLIEGNINSMRIGEYRTDQVVSGLTDGDARVFLNPAWTTTGQYCIQQSQPLPATVCGLIPEIVIGDTK